MSPVAQGVGVPRAPRSFLIATANDIFLRADARATSRSKIATGAMLVGAGSETQCPLTPTPDPSPQGGGVKQRGNKNAGTVPCNVGQRCLAPHAIFAPRFTASEIW